MAANVVRPTEPSALDGARMAVVATVGSVAVGGLELRPLEIEHRFGFSEPFSVGVEEELFLVDPLTGRADERVDGRPGAASARSTARWSASCTPASSSSSPRSATARARRSTRSTGSGAPSSPTGGLLGSGTHPSAAEGDAEITDKERYERIRYLLGDAVATPVGGLHIHVGMPDAETAIRAFNGLRRHLPLLQALAANSPFRHGRDTGLASAREVTLRGWPRSGAPRAMRDFEDFCATRRSWRAPRTCRTTRGSGGSCARTRASGPSRSARSTRRPRSRTPPRWSPSPTAWPATRPKRARRRPPPEVLEEGMFRAARFGVAAELPDPDGRLRPVSELLEAALDDVRDHAGELGCVRQLALLPDLWRRGGGAGVQRAIYERAGIHAVTKQLTDVTAAEAAPEHRPTDASHSGQRPMIRG